MIRSSLAVLFSIAVIGIRGSHSDVIHNRIENSFVIADANWTLMMKGEWMVKFFAPWCPACRNLESTWDSLTEWAADKELKFGGVDVTEESGLSGRFVITSLPTIYHVKEGIFRQYVGPRALADFQEYLDLGQWNDTEPVPSWKAPDSFLMSGISRLFGISLQLKDLHTHVTEKYGIPVWASFVIFGAIVVLLGLLLGMVMVILSDYLYGPPASYENMEEVQEGMVFEDDRGREENESNTDADGTEEGLEKEIPSSGEKEGSSLRQRKMDADNGQ